MNTIKPTQLYSIITNDNIEMLRQFFDTNPEFNLHHKITIGKKLPLLSQALESYSTNCSIYLMEKINFEDLVDKYSYYIIVNSNTIVNLFTGLFNQYIEETGDNNIVNKFLKYMLYTTSITVNNLETFVNSFVNHVVNSNDTETYKKVLYETIETKINFDKFSYLIDRTDNQINQLIQVDNNFKINLESFILKNGRINCIIKIIEVYEKFNIDLDDFYGRIILADKNSSYLKKTNKYFKNINLNQKVNIYSNHRITTYFNNANNNTNNTWKSKSTYSLVFLYLIKGFYSASKHDKFNLFNGNNFENELINLLSEENFTGWENLDYYGIGYQNLCQPMFYTILFTLHQVNKDINTQYYGKRYLINYFFGDDKTQKEEVIEQFNNLKPFLTNNFYNKLDELNELGLHKMNQYVEQLKNNDNNNNNNIFRNHYDEIIENTKNIYESNKNTIERLRIGF
jgi:hypothetical protein